VSGIISIVDEPSEEGDRVVLDDAVLVALAIVHDEYRDERWSGDGLIRLQDQLRARAAAERAAVTASLLAKHCKHALEPWMSPMLAAAEAGHPLLLSIDRILALVAEAQRRRASLIFCAD
jgi:hypothetical protein